MKNKIIVILGIISATLIYQGVNAGSNNAQGTDWSCVYQCTANGNNYSLCVDRCSWPDYVDGLANE